MDEFRAIVGDLLASADAEGSRPVAVGVSGMGPCVALADADGNPVRPAILYGVDTRSTRQIAQWTERLGAGEIMRRCGSALSSQAAGPKIAWVADNEPDAYARARRFYMPATWLVKELTGAYVLDHHSASQCQPMYDIEARAWFEPWAAAIAPGIELPPLSWPGDTAGTVTPDAAAATGLPDGIPVVTGTIDAWTEALSVDAHNPGDLMLMYGTTMLIPTVTIGAAHGAAWLAANAVEPITGAEWNPPARFLEPDPALRAFYDELYHLYLSLYPATLTVAHALAERQRRAFLTTPTPTTTTSKENTA